MLRRSLLLIALLAVPAAASDWTRWPLRQLIAMALERSCELANDERPDHSTVANVIAYQFPRQADGLGLSAALLAFDAARPDRVRDLEDARTRLADAERLDPKRPLVRFARGIVALAEARHAPRTDARRDFLARADAELAAVASLATGPLRFYARAARMSVAIERADPAELRLRASETIVSARSSGVPAEVEYRVRVAYERKQADLDAATAVYREARFLGRTRPPRIRRYIRGWNDMDEALRGLQRRWATWALVTARRSRDALGGLRGETDAWHGRMEAFAFLDLSEPAKALAAAKRARNEERSHGAQELVAKSLVVLGRLGEARGALERALRDKDGEGCACCLALLARVALVEGDDEAGARLALRAERADDGCLEVLAARALAARRRGDLEEANALGSRAFAAGARDEARAIARDEDAAKRDLDFGRFGDAEEHAASFLARRPASQRALRLLALATSKHGDPRAPLLVERLEAPQDGWALLQRGKARAARGQLEEARVDLRRGLSLLPVPPPDQVPEDVKEARKILGGLDQAARPRR